MSSSDQPLEAARALLEPGEVLLWADRPEAAALVRSKRQHFLRGVLGLVVITGFFWLSFLPNWPGGAKGVLLGGFLVLAVSYCLWLLAAPRLAATAAGRMVYAVTDRRAMILETWPRRRLRVFRPADLDEPQVLPADSGPGSVVFVHRKLPWWERSAGANYKTEAFYGIAESERVGAALEALRSGAPISTRLPEEDV